MNEAIEQPPAVDVPKRVESTEINKPLESLQTKLERQISSGKRPQLLCLDIDGTVYTLEHKSDSEKAAKVGDNTKTNSLLEQHSIPYTINSGRPNWTEKSDAEMAELGLSLADEVIFAGGGCIAERQADGSLELNQEYLRLMKSQPITSSEIVNGEVKTTRSDHYDANFIQRSLIAQLTDNSIRIDNVYINSLTKETVSSFVTLDLANLTFQELEDLSRKVKTVIGGVKVTFSENLDMPSADRFTGWMQVLPQQADKGRALRYIAEQTTSKINHNQQPDKKLLIHAIGDAAIDINMLAMGTGAKDPYEVKGYLLSNATPYASEKLKPVLASQEKQEGESSRRISHLQILSPGFEGPKGIEHIVEQITT